MRNAFQASPSARQKPLALNDNRREPLAPLPEDGPIVRRLCIQHAPVDDPVIPALRVTKVELDQARRESLRNPKKVASTEVVASLKGGGFHQPGRRRGGHGCQPPRLLTRRNTFGDEMAVQTVIICRLDTASTS